MIIKLSRKEAKLSGDKFYNTKKPCCKGHYSDRRTSTGHCISCEKIQDRENSRKYYQSHKESIKQKVSEYVKANKDKVLMRKKESYQEKREEVLRKQKIYRDNNVDAIRERNKKAYHSMTYDQREKERERLRIYGRKKYWSDPDKYRKEALDFQRKNRESNLERLAKWKENNKEWILQYRQLDYVKDKAKFFASRRRSIKLQAIPKWANLEKIEQIYASCPDEFHVDHIVPLVSKLVCGLHCEANLIHLSAKENMAKGNRVWPDMP